MTAMQATEQQTALMKIVEAGHASNCAKHFSVAAECTCGHADAELTLSELEGIATYSLFDLANAADTIFVDSIEAEEVGFEDYLGHGGEPQMRLTSDNDDFHFADQQVQLLSTGEVVVRDCATDEDDEATFYRLRLVVQRPLTVGDLSAKA